MLALRHEKRYLVPAHKTAPLSWAPARRNDGTGVQFHQSPVLVKEINPAMVKTLLLITESFPPLNTIAAQRFPPMLPILEAAGWQVFVLTKQATGPLPVHLAAPRILRIGRHHQEGLRISSGSTFARGSRARGAVRAVYQASGLILRSYDSSLLTWGRLVQRALPEIRTRLPAVDVVLGTYGPAAALWLARRLARLYQAPWIADFRDPGALRPDGRAAFAQWLDRRIERHLLRSAAAVTTCGESWAEELRGLIDRPVHVVYNGWDLRHFGPAPEPTASAAVSAAGGRPYLYFAGRFYERQIEAVRRLLGAVAGTPFAVVMRSLGPVEREATIDRLARELGVADQLRLLPPVPLATAHAEAQDAAANLVLETIDPAEDWARGHLSGKFLQLLPLPPPILFVARADSEAGGILRRTGKGALCTEVLEIRARLDQLAADGSVGGPVVSAAVAEFSKVRQGERLLALMEAVHDRARDSTRAAA
jgi:glycosyltransferase involved in cell wall biosynthesis